MNQQPNPMMDVWSRSGSRYRLRAVLLLGANVLLFAAVCGFAFWLRSGVHFAPATPGYVDHLREAFLGVGKAHVSLGSLLLEPINAQNVPMQIPIIGLLMATLISIPILVAILYRFWSSLPFIASVGLLAVMPWLALTLLLSCVLASVRPFRIRYRFMAALVGLIPAVVYMVLAWRGTADAIVGEIDPVDQIKFIAPWVLAIVAAAVVFAIVLTIARLVNYRPGAITPLLALMFGLPVLLFEYNVGRDELYFRLLKALDAAHFAEVDASLALEQSAMRTWERHPLPRPTWQAVRQVEEEKWLFGLATDLGPWESDLTRHQQEIVDRCAWFHDYFPDSRYVPSALFIKARALDRRVDVGEFRRTRWIRFYDDFPAPASRLIWQVLLANSPTSPIGAVAALRLAQLEARDCDVERAVDRLRGLIAGFDARGPETGEVPAHFDPHKGVLDRDRPEAGLNIPLEKIVLEAHRLKDLLQSNRDPIFGYEPLCGADRRRGEWQPGLLELDPRHEHYIENLRRLMAAYPNAQVIDNLELEIAKATPALPERIERLETLLRRFPDRDAAPEAMLRLALAYRETGRMERGDEIFAELFHHAPDSVWAAQAGRLLIVPGRTPASRRAAADHRIITEDAGTTGRGGS